MIGFSNRDNASELFKIIKRQKTLSRLRTELSTNQKRFVSDYSVLFIRGICALHLSHNFGSRTRL